ncbi:ATP synthase F1 subunit epsilon [Methylomagnum ishizawai]|uniref:ATP synthase F1 subunit epsilon n=1 Tax=Methylomagnum ishizawai TaxID=1760988 RepID=UPI001C329023|nr:ATP synthase F1 subunit epsilon [Methylomagnum ishizawai]BBL75914.1 ATP synthase epsilon chain [Methylomagnum ishizawai]
MPAPHTHLQVEIADVARLIYSGPCDRLVAPAALGEVCILPRHAPFLAQLRPGVVQIQTPDGARQSFFLSGGFMEVKDSTVHVLADHLLRSEEIDRDAALAARREAERILKHSHLFSERDRAKLELTKALAQLRVLEHAEVHRLKQQRGNL